MIMLIPFFGLIVLWLLVALIMIPWSVHKEQTKQFTNSWGFGNLNKFADEFNKRKWANNGWSNSLFDYSTNSKLHAGIIQFNGKGMVIRNPISYFIIKSLIKKRARQLASNW